jgi:hypothetical protein
VIPGLNASDFQVFDDDIKAGSSIIPVGRGMDISKLPIGPYRLEVQATDSTGKSTAWRWANFTVE